MKTCKKCLIEQSLDQFYKHKETRDGYQGSCKTCMNARISKTQIARRYGLTPEQYEEMTSKGCAVCGSLEDLRIDHDHDCCPGLDTCGKCVRGVLCDRHNKAEGFLRGSVDECMALAAYLIQSKNVLETQ